MIATGSDPALERHNGNYLPALAVETMHNVVLLRIFLALFPPRAMKFSLFDGLTPKHVRNIAFYGAGSFVKGLPKTKISTAKDRALVFNIWSAGYHHFITETLMKLVVCRDQLRDKTILVPENAPRFVGDFFRMLGVSSTEALTHHTIYRELTVVENPRSGFYNPAHVRLLRQVFAPFAVSGASPERIYVTRKQSRSRKVLNEDALEAMLRARGFTIVSTDSMSAEEQVSLFYGARMFVSIHGAGLTNMVFMPEGARIVELMPEPGDFDGPNYCYSRLSEALGHRYIDVMCRRENKATSFDVCNAIADIDAVARAVDA